MNKINQNNGKKKKGYYVELWLKFINGEDDAINEIYKDHYQLLFSYGQRFCKDTYKVEDDIHNLFLNLFKYRESLKEIRNVSSYLLISLRNLVIKNCGTKEVHFTLLEEMIPEEDQGVFDENIVNQIKELLNKLSPREKEIMYLKYYQNFNNKDISKILDIKYFTVRNLIVRALKKLRKIDKESLNLFFLLISLKNSEKSK